MNTFFSLPKLATLLIMSFLLFGCGSSSDNDDDTTTLGSVSFNLTAADEFTVPPIDGNGSGTGSLTLNRDTGELSGSITVNNLTGAITVAHIHEGLAGLTGGVIIGLEQDGTNAEQMNVPAGTTLSQAQMDAMLSAQYYVNVHTALNPAGEVRAQIVPADYEVIRVQLRGENQVPAEVTTSNSGIGYITINTSSGELLGNLRNSGLDDASAAHVHNGFAGTNGGILVGLTQDTGNTALWTIPATTLDTAQLANLLAGGNYFNVHTPANTNGEVRGQIIPQGIELDRVQLAGENEVPTPVSSAGSAVGYITVNTTSGALVANVRSTGLVDNTASHIHRGFAGESGGIVVGLTQDLVDSSLFSSDSGASFDATALDDFASGNLYFNLHTSTNPTGELRGQIAPGGLRVTRTELDGSQEVPAVTTGATGIGYTTVNPDDGSIVANVRTSGITATAAHVHQGAAGANGSIVLPLVQDTSDTDLWSASGSLSGAELDLFNADSLYFNVHSAANPSGEIRGQITP